jgi:hypothetical protein
VWYFFVLGTVPTVWYFFVLGTVPTVWYFFAKTKKYHTVGTVPKSYIKIVERDTIDTPYIEIT